MKALLAGVCHDLKELIKIYLSMINVLSDECTFKKTIDFIITYTFFLMIVALPSIVLSSDNRAPRTSSIDRWTVLIFKFRDEIRKKKSIHQKKGSVDVKSSFEAKYIVQ